MTLTRTFRISGALVALGVGLLVLRAVAGWSEAPWIPLGVVLLVGATPVFAVSAIRHLLRGLLWRVGSRLLVSYLLIVLIPLPFALLLGWAGMYAVTGQIAARRIEAAAERRLTLLEQAATTLFDRVAIARDPREVASLLEDATRRHALELPELSLAWHAAGGSAAAGPLGGAPLAPRDWIGGETTGFLSEIGNDPVLAAALRRPAGTLVLAVPARDPLVRRIESETDVVLQALAISTIESENDDREAAGEDAPAAPASASAASPTDDGKVRFRVGDEGVSISSGPGKPNNTTVGVEGPDSVSTPSPAPRATAARDVGSGPFRGRWVYWASRFERPVLDWETGRPRENARVHLVLQTSIGLEYRRLFGREPLSRGVRSTDVGSLVLSILRGFGWATLIAELLATAIGALLVWRIARATRRLTVGFGEISQGNFAHRATLRGNDQLAVLIDGFNRMASHLQESVAIRAERESLERELRVARDLQRRLLPASDFAFPGIEIATDFRPAAAIGGDFYHFAVEGGSTLVVVIADVSGHGLPTGIVMASAKASLSALASTGADTAAILTTLDDEIRRTTDRRTFVTLAHARFRLSDRRLELTNAGHLYPYRLDAEGGLSVIESPSRPLGVGLPADFTTVEVPLASGDLWVFCSDGIVEATNAEGEPFGFDRLEAQVRGARGFDAPRLRDRILESWQAHTGREEPEDDRTLLVLRIL